MNASSEPRLLVAIPVHNAIGVARRAFDYLIDSGFRAENVTVFDDGSTDTGWRDLSHRVRTAGGAYERSVLNRGYTATANLALQAGADFTLLMNSDCLVRAPDVTALLETARAFPLLASLGPLSNNAEVQSVRLAADRSWLHLSNAEIADAVEVLSTRLAWTYGRRPIAAPSLNGFCALWRTSAVVEAGGFDEHAFPRGYGEEDDLCFRLAEAGWTTAVAPWIFAVHFRSQSFAAEERGRLRPQAMDALKARYGARFIQGVIDHLDAHPLFQHLGQAEIDD
ncbi:hypothetical protein E4M02_03640 [Brevundimonas sp. S30B]|uniref:glycosyltransferase family 2 protein n=1 Tax=unclassified Brevundimonas TaxID=2622653 RepID=UPI00107216D6|nr:MULTISPECIES: glycosyltransferase [unclassified Brevundimonas]QBX37026.1 hypothetical protein E4M01_04175 [Brevundimonas sp. MF30-B]TFW04178.1 hypothetical protein E4M02_03640 [Brevundimonas sp. S30B]